MRIEQIYTGCLAHAAYYLEDQGEAAIFDPLREVGPYLDRAQKDNAKIKYVFETHFHADFLALMDKRREPEFPWANDAAAQSGKEQSKEPCKS